jgi:hypothetical protein
MNVKPRPDAIPSKIMKLSERLNKEWNSKGVTQVSIAFGLPNEKAPAGWFLMFFCESKKILVPEEIDGYRVQKLVNTKSHG